MVAITLQQESTEGSPYILYAHEDVLTRSSAILQTMLKTTTTTPADPHQQRQITLEKADAKSTNLYLNWLYTGNIHTGGGGGGSSSQNNSHPSTTKTKPKTKSPPETPTTPLTLLTTSYNLGTLLSDPSFRDALLDALVILVTIAAESPTTKTTLTLLMQRVKTYYPQLPAGSKARKLYVHLFAHFGDWRLLEKEDSHGFLKATREVLMRGAADDPTALAGRCGFHEHGVGGRCCRSRG